MCQINAKCVKSRSAKCVKHPNAKCVKLTSSAKCVKNINAKCVKLTRSANMWKWLTENVETTVIGWISLKLNFLCNSIRACAILRVRVIFSCPATSPLFSHFANEKNINLNGITCRHVDTDHALPCILSRCVSYQYPIRVFVRHLRNASQVQRNVTDISRCWWWLVLLVVFIFSLVYDGNWKWSEPEVVGTGNGRNRKWP